MVIAISPDETREYVALSDRELPIEQQTVWSLRYFTVSEHMAFINKMKGDKVELWGDTMMLVLRAGIVGEIGINGGPITTNERKSMRAAARAARITGAPIVIHLGGIGAEKHEMLDICEDEGVDLHRVILGHADDIASNTAFCVELVSRGVFIAFDNLARELEVAGPSLTAEVAAGIPPLIEAGFGDRILLSHDICWKTNLKTYGGPGFTFIQEKFLPHLRTLGVTDAEIEAIMVGNPARAHTFVAPPD